MLNYRRIFFICQRFLDLESNPRWQPGSARELEGLRCRSQRISPRPRRYSGVTECFILDLHGMSVTCIILHIYIYIIYICSKRAVQVDIVDNGREWEVKVALQNP